MANVRISDLTETATSIANEDLFLLTTKNSSDDAYTSKKINGGNFVTSIKNLIGDASSNSDGLMSKEDKSKLDKIDNSIIDEPETWVFTLEDGSTVTKEVYAKTIS